MWDVILHNFQLRGFISLFHTPYRGKKDILVDPLPFLLCNSHMRNRGISALHRCGPEKAGVFLDHEHIWLLLCMIKLYKAEFVDGTVNCSQTMISGSVPGPMQWFSWQNHICQLSAAETSPDSLKLLMISCAADDGIFILLPKLLRILSTAFCRLLNFYSSSLWLCLSKVLFLYLIMLLTCYQLN